MSTRKAKNRRLSPAEHKAAVEKARLWLSPHMRKFRDGDYRSGAETDVSNAYSIVKDVLYSLVEMTDGPVPSWLYPDLKQEGAAAMPHLDRLFSYAIQGARHHERKPGEKTMYHERDMLLARMDKSLLRLYGAKNAAERIEIVREALVSLKHEMSADAVRKGIAAGRPPLAKLSPGRSSTKEAAQAAMNPAPSSATKSARDRHVRETGRLVRIDGK
jgi:hypothetical protein